MAIHIDGLAVLHAIAENPLAFPDVVAELNKVARALVVKQFKAKATTLESLRHIHSAIGGEAFVLILDDLGDSGSASLVKRLDKDNSELKTAQPAWPRKRLADLARGAAVPAKKPPKPVPAKKASKLATAKNAPKPAQSPEQKALAAGSRPKRQIWPRRATFGAARRRKLHACSRRPGRKTDSGSAKKRDIDNPDQCHNLGRIAPASDCRSRERRRAGKHLREQGDVCCGGSAGE
jgi:hypothetical protein